MTISQASLCACWRCCIKESHVGIQYADFSFIYSGFAMFCWCVCLFACVVEVILLFALAFFLHLFSSFSSSSSTSPPAYSHCILYCSGPDMISA